MLRLSPASVQRLRRHRLELMDLRWCLLERCVQRAMKPCNKEKLMEAIREEHLSVEACNLHTDHGQQLLSVLFTTVEGLWTVTACNDGRQ